MLQVNNQPRKKYMNDFLVTSLILFMLARMGLVMTTSFPLFSYTIVFAVGIFTVFCMMYKSREFTRELFQAPLFFMIAYLAVIALSYLLTKSAAHKLDTVNHLKQIVLCLVYYAIGLGLGYFNKKVRKAIVVVFLIEILLSAGYTMYVAFTGPDGIIRQTAYSVVYRSLFPFAYGGFDFIYTCTMVYICIFQTLRTFFTRIRAVTKIVLIAVLALLALTIIVSGFSTAFALILLCTAFSFFKSTAGRVGFLIVAVAVLFLFPIPITNFILSIPFIPKLTSARICEVILSFTQSTASVTEGSYAGRWIRMQWSMDIFIHNPILGGYAGKATSAYGNHTEWLELLAKYGLFAFLFLIGFFAKGLKVYRLRMAVVENADKCMLTTLIMLVLIGSLNPISLAMTGSVLFVLAPNFCELFEYCSEPTEPEPVPAPAPDPIRPAYGPNF